jgi:hypothetical protein
VATLALVPMVSAPAAAGRCLRMKQPGTQHRPRVRFEVPCCPGPDLLCQVRVAMPGYTELGLVSFDTNRFDTNPLPRCQFAVCTAWFGTGWSTFQRSGTR